MLLYLFILSFIIKIRIDSTTKKLFIMKGDFMNIYIGQNIKKFRTKNNVTQEKLAEYLNVSYQAVSKWERGEAYPDITSLPALARFFNTTTDELLGVDNEKYEAEIKEFLDEINRLKSEGEERKDRELSKIMYQKYPNDFRVINRYMWNVYFDIDFDYDDKTLPDWRTIHSGELIPLCEKILADCVEDQIRFSAIDLLIAIYTGLKEYDTALEYANRFPNPDGKIGGILGEKDPEMGKYYQQKNFIAALEDMFPMFLFARYMINDPRKSIKLYKTAIDFYTGIFEEGNFGCYNWNMGRFYDFIAEQHIILGEYDAALDNMEIAAQYYIDCDNVPDGYKYTSPMTDRLTHYKINRWKSKGTCCDWQIGDYTSENMYDPLRDDKRFKAILQKLKEKVD